MPQRCTGSCCASTRAVSASERSTRRPATNHPGSMHDRIAPDEVAAGYRFPVHEREVVRIDRQRAQIQDPSKAEAFVGLPHVEEPLAER